MFFVDSAIEDEYLRPLCICGTAWVLDMDCEVSTSAMGHGLLSLPAAQSEFSSSSIMETIRR